MVVHGGAGVWKGARRRKGLRGVRIAASDGLGLLRNGRTALDAVEACIASMEDDSTFNAGYGSSLNLIGRVEMDASIMDGRTLQAGAVALLTRTKNPIRLARLVMEKTDHVLIAGRGAEHLARVFGLPTRNPVTSRAMRTWKLLSAQLAQGHLDYLPRMTELLRQFPELLSSGTVGAVARDSDGGVAAGTSTGGLALRLPGRIGDTPLIGSGTYADESGGCSTTGIGEGAIRLALAKTTCDLIRNGSIPKEAAEKSVRLLQRKLGMRIGLIAMDARGRMGSAHSTPHLCWAFAKSGMRTPRVAVKQQARLRRSV